MTFELRKIENCFADSQSYEYTLPLTGRELLPLLRGWELRLNEKLRRPVAIARRDRVIMKFMLADCRFRLSFPEDSWQEEKDKFELYLKGLICRE